MSDVNNLISYFFYSISTLSWCFHHDKLAEAMSDCGIATWHRQWFSSRARLGFIVRWRCTSATTCRSLRKGVNKDARSMVDYGVWARNFISGTTRHVNFTLTRRDSITIWGQCNVALTGACIDKYRGEMYERGGHSGF